MRSRTRGSSGKKPIATQLVITAWMAMTGFGAFDHRTARAIPRTAADHPTKISVLPAAPRTRLKGVSVPAMKTKDQRVVGDLEAPPSAEAPEGTVVEGAGPEDARGRTPIEQRAQQRFTGAGQARQVEGTAQGPKEGDEVRPPPKQRLDPGGQRSGKGDRGPRRRAKRGPSTENEVTGTKIGQESRERGRSIHGERLSQSCVDQVHGASSRWTTAGRCPTTMQPSGHSDGDAQACDATPSKPGMQPALVHCGAPGRSI